MRIKRMRTFLGNMAGPWTGWLLMRSLETLKVRMDRQESNAQKVAAWLLEQDLVEDVLYLGLLDESQAEQYSIFKKQCVGTGAMVSFRIKGGEAESFKFLNSLKLVKLAVSLGGTESLAEHPATMTHASIPKEEREKTGVVDSLIRLSIGIEDADDLIEDLKSALD